MVLRLLESQRLYTDFYHVIGGGDRMSNLGAGLGNIDWGKQSLTKFEKK